MLSVWKHNSRWESIMEFILGLDVMGLWKKVESCTFMSKVQSHYFFNDNHHLNYYILATYWNKSKYIIRKLKDMLSSLHKT